MTFFVTTGKKQNRSKADFAPAMVGVPGFEPGASWTRTKRDTKLRHTPKVHLLL